MSLSSKRWACLADNGYVIRHNGWVFFTGRFEEATYYDNKEDVPPIGHHSDMGGSGLKGRAVCS